MKLDEAIMQLDECNSLDNRYSRKIIHSKSLQISLVNSTYGLCICTNDWPQPYRSEKKHFEITDWEIVEHNK